jgi:hypothetical protein
MAAFLSIANGHQLTAASIVHFWKRLSAEGGLLGLCLRFATIVLNGVLGDLSKACLVFWRRRNPLSGCRAFTLIMVTDLGGDVERLGARVSPIPSEPKKQNAAWCRIYKAHADKRTILEAHRASLLTRDMAALAADFAPASWSARS